MMLLKSGVRLLGCGARVLRNQLVAAGCPQVQCLDRLSAGGQLRCFASKSIDQEEKEPARTAGMNPNDEKKVLKSDNPLSATKKQDSQQATPQPTDKSRAQQSPPSSSSKVAASSSTSSSSSSNAKSLSMSSSSSTSAASGSASSSQQRGPAKSSSSGSSSSSSSGKGIQASDYKVQEYFNHSAFTFYDVEKAMTSSRLEQPSAHADPHVDANHAKK